MCLNSGIIILNDALEDEFDAWGLSSTLCQAGEFITMTLLPQQQQKFKQEVSGHAA